WSSPGCAALVVRYAGRDRRQHPGHGSGVELYRFRRLGYMLEHRGYTHTVVGCLVLAGSRWRSAAGSRWRSAAGSRWTPAAGSRWRSAAARPAAALTECYFLG